MSLVNALLFTVLAIAASFVLPALAWLVSRTQAAAIRHLIWTGVFAILLALPLAALLLPSQMNVLVPAAPGAPAIDGPVSAAAPVAAGFGLAEALLVIAAVWAAGVVYHLARLGVAAIGLARLHRCSVAHIPHAIAEAPFRGLSWQLRLRTSPGDSGPLTWGVVKPVVLLPKASVTWPRERLMSVLLHEAAHVRRFDCLSRLIAALVCTLYWPNPLVWIAARAQRADAECAADDAVLAAGVKPSSYASHLVGLAREFSSASLAMSLSMAEQRSLDARVEAILDPQTHRSGVTKMDVLKLGAAVVALTAGLALVRPSLAETPSPAAPVKPATTTHTKTITRTIVKTSTDSRPHTITITRVITDGDTNVGDIADVPVPPAPPAPEAPPAPPAPASVEAPPAPPVPPAPPAHQVSIPLKLAIRMQAKAESARAVAEARRALAHVNIQQTVAEAMRHAEKALRDAKVSDAQAKKALAHMDIDRVVADALKKAEIAMRQAERDQARFEYDSAEDRGEE